MVTSFLLPLQLSVGIVFETEIDAGDQGFLNKLRPVEHFNEVWDGGDGGGRGREGRRVKDF